MLVKNSNFHYQTEKFNYQKAKINCQKEILTYLKKCKRKEEQKNILAGKYLEEYYSYSDNCNDGEYISLTSYNNSIEFQNFVRPYIRLVINPFIEAYKTIYVPCEIWDYMKKRNLPLKNRYSYACNEYQAKDHISLDMVMAIGIPYFDILFQQGRESAKALTSSIRHLLAYHDLDIPIVDITCYNQVINPKEKQNVFQKK